MLISVYLYKRTGGLFMELTEKSLDKFLAQGEDNITEAETIARSKKIVENDGLIERTTLIEKKLIVEDGRQLLTEERPITHSQLIY